MSEKEQAKTICWFIEPQENNLYKIENPETKKIIFVSLETTINRQKTFDLIKADFDEKQTGKIWNELLKMEENYG